MSQAPTIRIAMWSGPRNISTAMMRAFENRPDTAVVDEPFYAASLAATGAENHWGPERHWPELRRLYLAVDHPGFGISCHLGGWAGSPQEVAEADRRVAPWVCHTHLPWDITEGPLEEKMVTLRDAGYTGYYSVEHHSAQREYAEVGVQLARVRAVLDGWRVLAADGVFASREAAGAPPAAAPAQPAPSPNSGAPGVSTVVR